VSLARARGQTPTVVSFYPHPLTIIRPGHTTEKITSLRQQIKLLEQLGVEILYLVHFTDEVANLSPAKFFERVLLKKLECKSLLVGSDFHIGKNRSGDTAVLGNLCKTHSVDFHVSSLVTCGADEKVGSREIRRVMKEGNIGLAQSFLGRPVAIEGKVVRGDGRGRKIGFPTANLHVRSLLPLRRGVYAARASSSEFQNIPAVLNIGVRPTFSRHGSARESVSIEAHLLGDTTLDLYNKRLTLELLGFIRDEKTFSSVEDLKRQIQADIHEAQGLL
jgi:riboflavin kinase/FMN adenylyltransferase